MSKEDLEIHKVGGLSTLGVYDNCGLQIHGKKKLTSKKEEEENNFELTNHQALPNLTTIWSAQIRAY